MTDLSCLSLFKSGWRKKSLTLSPLAVNFEDRWWPLQAIWVQMKPHKMWGSSEIQIVWHSDYISAKYLGGNIEFLHLLKEKNIWKNYPACKELNLNWYKRKYSMGYQTLIFKVLCWKCWSTIGIPFSVYLSNVAKTCFVHWEHWLPRQPKYTRQPKENS